MGPDPRFQYAAGSGLEGGGKTPEALARIKQTLEDALTQFPDVGHVAW
jgi:hypothetical protein